MLMSALITSSTFSWGLLLFSHRDDENDCLLNGKWKHHSVHFIMIDVMTCLGLSQNSFNAHHNDGMTIDYLIGCFISFKNDENRQMISNIHWKEKCLKHHSKMMKSEMLSRLIDALVTTMDSSDEWSVWLMTTWTSIWGVTSSVIIDVFHFSCHRTHLRQTFITMMTFMIKSNIIYIYQNENQIK